MSIRKVPGRPRKGEPPSPSRLRRIKVPLDLDEQLANEAPSHGLSYQGAVREAIALILEKWHGPDLS